MAAIPQSACGGGSRVPTSTNAFLLAADNSPHLLPLLHENPELASEQDEHGYSLMHAAASYNHLDLLRTLVNDFLVDVDLKDEDGETALFVVETIECAKILVEELNADITIRGFEGMTAREKIAEEGDFPQVAVYLKVKELEAQETSDSTEDPSSAPQPPPPPPPLPEGVSVDFGTMAPEDVGEVVDPDFRRKIEELALRDDFEGAAGQKQLRELITQVLSGKVGQEREVRQRMS